MKQAFTCRRTGFGAAEMIRFGMKCWDVYIRRGRKGAGAAACTRVLQSDLAMLIGEKFVNVSRFVDGSDDARLLQHCSDRSA